MTSTDMGIERHGEYAIGAVFGEVSPALAEEIAAFWLAHGALPDPAEARRRAHEVVCLARDAAGTIAAVNSVYVAPFNPPGAPYYFYRMFVRPSARVPGLASRMVQCAVAVLRARAAPGVAGVVLITENPKLMLRAGQRKLTRLGWSYVGRGPLGRDAWRIDFAAPADHA